jgi:hypothetical protein
MRFYYYPLLGLFALAACQTPADTAYCEKFSVSPEHPEYGQCLRYFQGQQAAFNADKSICDIQADKTYPRDLYDTGRQGYISGGFGSGFGGHFGGYRGSGFGLGGGTVYSPPDRHKNALIDQLRLKIIAPCMQSRGWNDPLNWERGRHSRPSFRHHKPTPKRSAIPKQTGTLPWLKQKDAP